MQSRIQAAGVTPITFSNEDKDSISQKFYFLSIAAADGTWDPEEFYVGIVDGSGKMCGTTIIPSRSRTA